MYYSYVYPIIELLVDHIHTYTDDDYCLIPRILQHACISGSMKLFNYVLNDKRVLSDVREDIIQTYIRYSFWKRFCCRKYYMDIDNTYNTFIDDVQKNRIQMADILFKMYPGLMIYSASQQEYNISTYYCDACSNGIYTIAEYIIDFSNKCNMKITNFDYIFTRACQTGEMGLIEMYYKWNPYKYSIFVSHESIDTTLTTSNNYYEHDKNVDYIIHIRGHDTKYGIVRSLRNELWERKRLLLYKLNYEGETPIMPIDLIRHIFSFV
jgi:hypothetical protein